MSFSKNAKLQILNKIIENDCCSLAFFCGLIHSAGQVIIKDNVPSITIVTDTQELYGFINDNFSKLYGDYTEIEIYDDYKINKTTYYKIIFPKDLTLKLLVDCDLVELDSKNNFKLKSEIPSTLLNDECCKKSFIKGAFIGCGTSSIKLGEAPNLKTSSGYNIEFTSKNKQFLTTLANVLTCFDILGKLIARRNLFVLYIKEASMITDLLAIMEAYDSVLSLNDEMAKRELRNKINRQTNCISANIGKTVDASFRQTKAITVINDLVGLEVLPLDLQVVALLRLANPEESLEELIKIGDLKLTKSGLNHRLKKIEKIAEELGK